MRSMKWLGVLMAGTALAWTGSTLMYGGLAVEAATVAGARTLAQAMTPKAAISTAATSPVMTPARRIPGHIVRRTATSNTWVNKTGSYTTQMYPGPVNYRGPHGHWRPIANTLDPSTHSGFAWQTTHNRWTSRFPTTLADRGIEVQDGTSVVRCSLRERRRPRGRPKALALRTLRPSRQRPCIIR